MDASASEWSSGCESGWTLYLDESSQSLNKYQSNRDHNQGYRPNNEEEEEEDMSMVSDASSGPPNFRYEEEEEEEVVCFRKKGFYSPSMESSAKKNKTKEVPRGNQHRHSYLDDTASSPALSCSKVPSKNQPGNFGFWQSSNAKRQEPAEPSLFRGRRRG